MVNQSKEDSSKELLKDRIIKTATKAFAENGIKGVTMDEIAALLGISKRTLYEVFADKEALLKECLLYLKDERDRYSQQAFENSNDVLEVILMVFKKSLQTIHSTNRRFFLDLKRYPRVYEIMKNNRQIDSEQAISFFKLGVEQGLFRSDINFKIATLLVREQFELLLNTDICKDYPFVEVYESIMFTYLRGIATEFGAKRLEAFLVDYREGKLDDIKE